MSKKTTPKNKQVYNALDLIEFAWQKKIILIAVSLVAFVTSIIVSLTIEEKFSSHVVLFPAASISVSKNLVETSSISMDSRDVLSFGKDEDAERMLQILRSDRIRGYIIEKHNLFEHYEIDPDQKYQYTILDRKFKGNVKTRRTEYNSLEITVLDKDPIKAAVMANDMAAYIDSTVHQMQRERAVEAFRIVEKEYKTVEENIKELNERIQKIRELGVIDYESQAAALNQAYAEALAKGNREAMKLINEKMNTLSKYGGEYVALSKQLESEIERFGQLKDKYAAAKVNVEQALPQIFIVDEGAVSEKKAYPHRTKIVVLSTFSTFAFALLLLLIWNNIKNRE